MARRGGFLNHFLGQKFNFSKQLGILGPAFGQSKIIENLTSHETGPNSKIHTPGRPKVDLYSIFDDFGNTFAIIIRIFSHAAKNLFSNNSILATFRPSKTSPFGIHFL